MPIRVMAGAFSSLLNAPLIPGAASAGLGADTSPEPLSNVGRRSAARLRLSIPARLITVSGSQRCVLLDLSITGAQIGLPRPLALGDAAFLRFSDLEVFGSAVRADTGLNGLEFDYALAHEDVLATRHYAETHEAEERAALMREVRSWVTGV